MSRKQKNNLQSLIDQGDACYKALDFDGAIEFYDKAIALDKESALAWNGRGLSLISKGQFDLGLFCYKRALKIDNTIAVVWNNIGAYYFQIGKYEDAYNNFLKSIELEPSLLAYYNLCFLFFEKGEYFTALQYIEKALIIAPDNSLLWSSKGNLFFELGYFNDAIDSLNKSIQIDNNNFDAYNSLGFIYLVKQDYPKAEENLFKSLEINNNYHAALSNISLLYREKEECQNALEYAKRAIDIAPSIPSLWADLGSCLYNFIMKEGTDREGTLEDVGAMFAKGERSTLSVLIDVSNDNLSAEDIKTIIYKMLENDNFFNEIVGSSIDREIYKDIYYQSLKVISLLHITGNVENKFGHYTNRNTIEALLFDESPFRLNTVATANDPEEGLPLLQIINLPQIYLNTQFQAFVGCFTFNYDSLNQFRLYGKSDQIEATGVSIVVNDNFFEEDPAINKSLIINSNNALSQPKAKESLFRCIYVDPQTSRVISIGHKESSVFYRESHLYEDVDLVVLNYQKYISQKEQDVIKEMRSLVDKINKLYTLILEDNDEKRKEEREHSLSDNLPTLLIHLRYLVKHYAFKEEQECRIIKVEKLVNNSNIVVDNSKTRMYIDYLPVCQRREGKNYTTDLFFGPKAEGFEIFRDRINHSGLFIYSYKSMHPFS